MTHNNPLMTDTLIYVFQPHFLLWYLFPFIVYLSLGPLVHPYPH